MNVAGIQDSLFRGGYAEIFSKHVGILILTHFALVHVYYKYVFTDLADGAAIDSGGSKAFEISSLLHLRDRTDSALRSKLDVTGTSKAEADVATGRCR